MSIVSMIVGAVLIALAVVACALRFYITMSRESKVAIADYADAVVSVAAPFAAAAAVTEEMSEHDKAVERNKKIQTKMSMQSVGMAPASLARG